MDVAIYLVISTRRRTTWRLYQSCRSNCSASSSFFTHPVFRKSARRVLRGLPCQTCQAKLCRPQRKFWIIQPFRFNTCPIYSTDCHLCFWLPNCRLFMQPLLQQHTQSATTWSLSTSLRTPTGWISNVWRYKIIKLVWNWARFYNAVWKKVVKSWFIVCGFT